MQKYFDIDFDIVIRRRRCSVTVMQSRACHDDMIEKSRFVNIMTEVSLSERNVALKNKSRSRAD